jgi:hypothetical protein
MGLGAAGDGIEVGGFVPFRSVFAGVGGRCLGCDMGFRISDDARDVGTRTKLVPASLQSVVNVEYSNIQLRTSCRLGESACACHPQVGWTGRKESTKGKGKAASERDGEESACACHPRLGWNGQKRKEEKEKGREAERTVRALAILSWNGLNCQKQLNLREIEGGRSTMRGCLTYLIDELGWKRHREV